MAPRGVGHAAADRGGAPDHRRAVAGRPGARGGGRGGRRGRPARRLRGARPRGDGGEYHRQGIAAVPGGHRGRAGTRPLRTRTTLPARPSRPTGTPEPRLRDLCRHWRIIRTNPCSGGHVTMTQPPAQPGPPAPVHDQSTLSRKQSVTSLRTRRGDSASWPPPAAGRPATAPPPGALQAPPGLHPAAATPAPPAASAHPAQPHSQPAPPAPGPATAAQTPNSPRPEVGHPPTPSMIRPQASAGNQHPLLLHPHSRTTEASDTTPPPGPATRSPTSRALASNEPGPHRTPREAPPEDVQNFQIGAAHVLIAIRPRPSISAGRRAVIQRASRRWRPGHSPMHHRLDCMSQPVA